MTTGLAMVPAGLTGKIVTRMTAATPCSAPRTPPRVDRRRSSSPHPPTTSPRRCGRPASGISRSRSAAAGTVCPALAAITAAVVSDSPATIQQALQPLLGIGEVSVQQAHIVP
ncbi:hypothetical protein Sme01_20310 [Sphaerisporangium melleum]|uniref:Uncharacterized protein n=1 Tax=Sphaerisporangium melleum TaxID=321316 RepID=A0A917RLE0_9ACTN|nr:DUF3723 domain-containing protein [Sphaerisporangium melleum]GGL12973.1 hypothetical protein GCM10007964_63860 [Sphaerisporangium melleum]GII69555.1 hypothetical protein Sme01_20310 [Sphaerisporangium melleum]